MRPFCVADTECYPNYWSIQLREVHGQRRTRVFERMPGHPLDVAGVHRIMRNFTLVGFNLIGYDSPMIAFALSGATNGQLKAASDDIIKGGLKFWQFRDKYGVELPEYVDAVDVMEVSPGSPQKPEYQIASCGGYQSHRQTPGQHLAEQRPDIRVGRRSGYAEGAGCR